jgi:ubiquinone/menaquinone biosynthesis C-methylase UbiE
VAFIDRFSEHSELYARARPAYPDALFEAIALDLNGRNLAWDCGTGNGQAAVKLAKYFDHVHATDPSPQQLGNAVRVENVEYGVGQAEESDLPSQSVDLVFVAQALHWFDLDRFYGEARRVLKSNGTIAVVGYDPWVYVSSEIDRTVWETLLKPIRPFWAKNDQLVWDGYRSIEFPFTERRLPPVAIHLEWDLQQLLAYVCSLSATRAAIRESGEQFLRQAQVTLESIWGDSSSKKHVVMPLHTRCGQLE